jgi:cholesterol transport system auxiliary component
MKRLVVIASFALSGCGGGILAPAGPAPKIYTLSAPATVETSAPAATWQLLIDEPNAILDLNSSRIAIEPEPTRIDYYANVVWADRPPTMLQELLLQTFDRSGRIPAVQRQSGGLRSDFELATDIEDFEVEAAPGETDVHVAVTARLIRARDRAIVASRAFQSRTPVSGDFDGVVAGFDQALRDMLPRIVDWTLTEGRRDQ